MIALRYTFVRMPASIGVQGEPDAALNLEATAEYKKYQRVHQGS